MKIRWTGPKIEGYFHNNPHGVHRGQIIETDDDDYDITDVSLKDYLDHGWAESVWETRTTHDTNPDPPVEHAVAPEPEKAALTVPPEVEKAVVPEPLDEPDEPEDEPEHKELHKRPPVRRPRR